MLSGPVVVDEKLNGANVMVWVDDDGRLTVSLRSGPAGMDRAGQLGPLRAWVAAPDGPLRKALRGWMVLYAERLYLRHTVAYDRLPSYFVALDLWSPAAGFATPEQRVQTGLVLPPVLTDRPVRSVSDIEALLGPSVWTDAPMEGAVFRCIDGQGHRLAKLVRTGWEALDDESWRSGRPTNRLAEGVSAWL